MVTGNSGDGGNRTRAKFPPRIREELRELQGGLCATCGAEGSNLGHDLCIDHDHATGRARGLLCRACNIGLGSFRDDTSILRAAIGYLEAPPGRMIWQDAIGQAGDEFDGVSRANWHVRRAVVEVLQGNTDAAVEFLKGADALLRDLEHLYDDDEGLRAA